MILGAAPSIAGSSSTPPSADPFSSPPPFDAFPTTLAAAALIDRASSFNNASAGSPPAGSPPRLAYTRSFFSTSVTTHFLFLLSGREWRSSTLSPTPHSFSSSCA